MYLHAGLEASSTQVRLVCFFLGDRGFAFYDLEESSIFLRLTAELAGKYALIVIFVCLWVGMWGILAGVYILAVKEWVLHLGLAFLRSCFVLLYHIFLLLCLSLCFRLFVDVFQSAMWSNLQACGSSGRP